MVIGLAVVAGLVLAVRQWGRLSAEKRILERGIEAARTRKAIDNEVQKLSPDELATRLRSGM